MKGRHVAHEVRKEALIEVIDKLGMENFVAVIDDQIKSGEVIEWDDPDREGAQPPEIDDVDLDVKLNHYVRLRLPADIEKAVWNHTEAIAARRPGRRIKAKVDEAFNSFQEIYSMRLKSHEGAVRHGFPSYAQ
eukprot:5715699-Amphidinium_carterae.1